jgi:hypothetical protein
VGIAIALLAEPAVLFFVIAALAVFLIGRAVFA